MSTVVKDLGAVSAYAYAVEKGYTGTEAEFAELMADYAEVGQRAEDAADSALESKTAAQTAATTATNKATEATTAATTATNKAAEAQADADAAALDASQALSAASTATSKATEATTAAATATSAASTATTAKDDAVSAKTAAQTAQTGAETAAASVSASAEQIATNAADISQLKSDLNQLKDVTKNLLPISDASIVVNSVGVTYEDGVLSLSGTGTASGGRTTNIITLTLPAGNYTFSAYDKLADFAIFVEKVSDNSILAELTNTIVTSQSDTFTLNTETSVYLGVNVGRRSYDASCRIQLESGNESTSYVIPSNYHAYDEVARADIQDLKSDIYDIKTNITYNVDLSNESAESKKLINSNNGTEILNQADIYGVTDFIDISSLAGLKCSITSLFGGWFGVAFYNKNREFIKGLSSTSTGAIDGAVSKVNTSIPEDAVYIRWSLLTDFVVANYPIACNENAINVVNKRLEVDDVKLIENDFSTVSVFENIGICGDSFASGEIHVGNNAGAYYNLSWGQILGRKCGINVYNYSVSGYSTQSFLTSASRGLPKLLSDEAKNLYIMAFGLNDINIANYLGSISDIKSDYSQNPDTFYGNYARIIEQVQAHAPNAKIVLSTMARHFEEPQYSAFDDAIVEIANHYSIPVLITKDDPFFNSSFFEDGLVTYHPTAVLYGGMSEAYQRLFSKATITYRSYFADYIG